MKSHARLWKALNHEEADRVPTFTQSIETPFIRRFDEQVGIEDDYGFPLRYFDLIVAKALGYDSKWVHVGGTQAPPDMPEVPPVPAGHRVNSNGHLQRTNPEDHSSWYVDGVLKTPDLLRQWTSYVNEFEPADAAHWEAFAEVWRVGCEQDLVPIPTAGGPTYVTWAAIGMDRFAYMMRKYPHLVSGLVDAWTRITKKQHACLFEQGIDMVFICDDHAYKDRLMLSPKQYDQFVYPMLKTLADHAHAHGAKFILHTDGCLVEAFPALVRAGVDAAEPLEYEAGNRLAPLKEQYGDKITLIGNVAASDVLCKGTVADTVAATKACIDAAAAGGGYILSQGANLLADSRLENVRAMLETARTYGTYAM